MEHRLNKFSVFDIINYIFMAVVLAIMMFPLLYILKQSVDVGPSVSLQLNIIPEKVSFIYYQTILRNSSIYTPFLNSVIVTIAGTVIAMAFQTMGGYVLSYRKLPGIKFFTFIILVPMFFSGGMIPGFLLIKSLGLMNSLWALIIPGCIGTWNLLLLRNYFYSIPESLRESAEIDGASPFTVFYKIILPLSAPVLAAITLFVAVGYWNTFFSAVLYINDPTKYTFTVKLRELLIVQESMTTYNPDQILLEKQSEGLRSAIIIVAMVPIMIIYPFLQKYFVKGILIGSLKG